MEVAMLQRTVSESAQPQVAAASAGVAEPVCAAAGGEAAGAGADGAAGAVTVSVTVVPLPSAPSRSQASEASDSGTDTDDEGLLIKQAAAELLRHKQSVPKMPSSKPVTTSINTGATTSTVPTAPALAPSAPSDAAAAAPMATSAQQAPPAPLPAPQLQHPPNLTAPSSAAAACGTTANIRAAPSTSVTTTAPATRGSRPGPGPGSSTRASTGARAAPKRPAGSITMKSLIQAGFLIPGEQVLYVEYKGSITRGDLNTEGQIVCGDMLFESPSAFSIYIKRLVNPTRKADDGWKAVKFDGKLLEHYKDEFLRWKYSSMLPSSEPGTPPPPPLASTLEEAAAGLSFQQPSAVAAPPIPPPPLASTLEEPASKRQRTLDPSQYPVLPPPPPSLSAAGPPSIAPVQAGSVGGVQPQGGAGACLHPGGRSQCTMQAPAQAVVHAAHAEMQGEDDGEEGDGTTEDAEESGL